MKNVIVRASSGAVYVALIVGAVLAGGYWFVALAALLTVLGILEYQGLVSHRTGASLPWYVRALDMCVALTLVGAALVTAHLSVMELGTAVVYITFALILYVLLRLVLALGQRSGDAFGAAAYSILGTVYVAVPLGLLAYYIVSTPGEWFGPLGMFVLIWLNDTGAFCFGSMLGRHRLCERLSPKKSWEGFWGGLLTCVVAALVAAPVREASIVTYVVYAVVVSVMSTWGDLFESLMKRSAQVKDAGHLIPGHGGVLDRIDSLLFVIPASAIFLVVLEWF